jgi:hypothetical protein
MSVPYILKLNHNQAMRHRKEVKQIILRDPPATNPGDTLTVTYNFSVDITSSAEQQLDALLKILNDQSVQPEFSDDLVYARESLKRYHIKFSQLLFSSFKRKKQLDL